MILRGFFKRNIGATKTLDTDFSVCACTNVEAVDLRFKTKERGVVQIVMSPDEVQYLIDKLSAKRDEAIKYHEKLEGIWTK